MSLTMFNEKENVLYINSKAITKKCKTMNEGIAYMKKPYSQRIEESSYKKQIESELLKHPGCKISEFCSALIN